MGEVLRMNMREIVLIGTAKRAIWQAKEGLDLLRPGHASSKNIPVPGSHFGGFESQSEPLFARLAHLLCQLFVIDIQTHPGCAQGAPRVIHMKFAMGLDPV